MNLIEAQTKDILELKEICINAYSKNFYDHWNKGGLEWYLDKEFNEKRLESDLIDKNTVYYFINHEFNTVGFIKINNKAVIGSTTSNAVELEKIYVLPECKGMGIGKMALQEIINKSAKDGKKNLFLSVIETNVNAIAFYKKNGFQFHSKTILDVPYFKEELKGMDRMVIEL